MQGQDPVMEHLESELRLFQMWASRVSEWLAVEVVSSGLEVLTPPLQDRLNMNPDRIEARAEPDAAEEEEAVVEAVTMMRSEGR